MEYFSINLGLDTETVLHLLQISMLPIVMSVIFYLLQTYTKAKRIRFWPAQLIIGFVFGICSILGTELGVPIEGAVINVRDAAPVCAGLLFGAPAGILSGLMGGLHRFFIASGDYTRVACTLSTILAGILAGALRKHLFDNKRPAAGVGFFVSVVIEVIHMALVFVTHIDESARAFEVVQICTIPMVFVNSLAVALATLVISIVERGINFRTKKLKNISQVIQTGLIFLVILGYILTTTFVYAIQTSTAVTNATKLLEKNIEDVEEEIRDSVNDKLIKVCYNIKLWVDMDDPDISLENLALQYGADEINVVNADGVVTATTNAELQGYDMKDGDKSGEQSRAFMVLTEGTREFAQDYGPCAYDSSVYMKYVGMSLSDGGFVQVGFVHDSFKEYVDDMVEDLTAHRHISSTGYMLISNDSGKIVSNVQTGKSSLLKNSGISITEDLDTYTVFRTEVYGEDCLCMYQYVEGYYIIGVIPWEAVFEQRTASVYVNSFMEVLVFAALFILVYLLIKTHVVDKIKKINLSLARIIRGELETEVDVRSSIEFSALSDDINFTVDTLKQYIADAAARIDKELAFAKSIQHSALPNIFPDEERYSLYATMDTAKEVGGDFYDFYKLDQDTLAILIADVSGKGIPAAMFMMQSKTMIKNLAESGMPINEVMTVANDRLCETNEAGMFVTTWLAFINLKTGHVQFVNAGHNPPVLFRAGQRYDYMRSKVGLVLAGMEGIRYRMQEFDLEPGDKLYLYTDGITEATDAHEELYGEDRLLTYLNANTELTPKETLLGVKADVDKFVAEAEQFDDMTMLMVAYKGEKK